MRQIKTKLGYAGFTLVEAVISAALVAGVAMTAGTLVTYSRAGVSNSRSESGAQSLRAVVSETLADPNLCTAAITKGGVQTFNASQTNISNQVTGTNAQGGLPLQFSLSDAVAGGKGTNISRATTTSAPPYSVNILSLKMQTVGTAKPLTWAGVPLVDPNPGVGCAKNNVYSGDVYLNLEKSGGGVIAGGTGMKSAYVGTLLLTVDSTSNKICRCYQSDPCLAVGGTYSANATPNCQVCPLDKNGNSQTWVGLNPTTGLPICLPNCSKGQMLVSSGAYSATCQAPPVNGLCGTAMTGGASYSSLAALELAQLCATGTATAPVLGANWSWTCLGTPAGVGANMDCTAKDSSPPTPGKCGPSGAASMAFSTTSPPTGAAALCTTPGTPSVPVLAGASGPWSWTCTGNTGGPVPCQAALKSNGFCGSAVGIPTATAPAANLCKVGAPTVPVQGASLWTWSCGGVNGGTASVPACTAPLKVASAPGQCGPADGVPSATQPATASLCAPGQTAFGLTGGSYWTWGCNGTGTGAPTAANTCQAKCASPAPTTSCAALSLTNAPFNGCTFTLPATASGAPALAPNFPLCRTRWNCLGPDDVCPSGWYATFLAAKGQHFPQKDSGYCQSAEINPSLYNGYYYSGFTLINQTQCQFPGQDHRPCAMGSGVWVGPFTCQSSAQFEKLYLAGTYTENYTCRDGTIETVTFTVKDNSPASITTTVTSDSFHAAGAPPPPPPAGGTCTVTTPLPTPTPTPAPTAAASCPAIPYIPLASAPIKNGPHGLGWTCLAPTANCPSGWHGGKAGRFGDNTMFCAEPEGETTISFGGPGGDGCALALFACQNPVGRPGIPAGHFSYSFSCSDGKTETVSGTCGPGSLILDSDNFN